jgi:hypothetical protein
MLPEIWRPSTRTGIASMLRGKAGICPSLAALLLLPGLFVLTAGVGNPVTVQLYSGVSSPIYVSAGTVTINFSYFLMYGGKGDPVGDNADGVQPDSLLGYNNSGDLLATLPIVGDPAFEHEGSGTITWSNPVDQLNQAPLPPSARSGSPSGEVSANRRHPRQIPQNLKRGSPSR